MSQVTARETPVHRMLVSVLVRYFQRHGWKVTAAAREGFREPRAIGRHEPDVLGINAAGTTVIGEVKTGEGDLGTRHAKEQYRDFSRRVMRRNGTACPFYLLVPKRVEAEAERQLRQVGVLPRSNVHVLTFG